MAWVECSACSGDGGWVEGPSHPIHGPEVVRCPVCGGAGGGEVEEES